MLPQRRDGSSRLNTSDYQEECWPQSRLRQALSSIQLWATIAALILAPLFFGSVDRFWVASWTIVLSISVLFGTAKGMNIGQLRLLYAFLAIASAYAIVAVIQIIPNLIVWLDDPIWSRASDLLGLNLPSRISSRAEIPPIAIGHFLLVVTSFINGFFVGTSRRESDLLTALARYSILLYSIYGLLALVFTPNMLLWAQKTAYYGSLTASFVNHNTAATFVAMGAIMWLCLALATLRSLQFSSLRVLLLSQSNEYVALRFILRSAAALSCFLALLLTRSRGGLICFCFGLLVAIGSIIAGRLKVRSWYILACACAVVALVFDWLTQTGRIGSEGLLDYGRSTVYENCIAAIRQRPLLGSGVGTFADLFPSVRSPDLSMWGVWDYAHSTILEVAVEMGIPITAIIAFAAIASFLILLRSTLRSKDRRRTSFAAMTGIAVLAYLHSIIDFSLQIPGFLIVFWILLGCWLAQSFATEPMAQRASMGERVAAKSTTNEAREPVDASIP
jgi:O-antigen ligase